MGSRRRTSRDHSDPWWASDRSAPISQPRQSNLWVTDTVEWRRETRPAYPLPDGEGFGPFS
jgi:hypothetical protein